MLPVSTLKFCPQNPTRKGDGQENGGHVRQSAAHDRQVLARERGVQTQQGVASLLDRGEVGYDLLQLVVDVFGVEPGFAGGAGQGLDALQACA